MRCMLSALMNNHLSIIALIGMGKKTGLHETLIIFFLYHYLKGTEVFNLRLSSTVGRG